MAVLVLGAVVVAVVDDGTGIVPQTWWKVALTLLIGGALWWRRRFPFALALVAAAGVAVGASELALPVTLLTLAMHQRDRRLSTASVAAAFGYLFAKLFDPAAVDPAGAALAALTNTVLFVGLPVAVGAYLGTRRQLERQLVDRAERAEGEQVLRAEQARLFERTRIAREMHDVLAHRVSLVAMQAGALEMNPASTPEEVSRSAALIGFTARQALDELREVLGVLRSSHPGDERLRPQPTLAELDRLVSASTGAGVEVRLHDDLAGVPLPGLLSRTAYRVVQEGLTNVRKHAPGVVVTVGLSGAPGGTLAVDVSNGGPLARPPLPLPVAAGSGLGLVGLRERVGLAGGSFHAGPEADGGFRVHAQLPWPLRPGVTG